MRVLERKGLRALLVLLALLGQRALVEKRERPVPLDPLALPALKALVGKRVMQVLQAWQVLPAPLDLSPTSPCLLVDSLAPPPLLQQRLLNKPADY